MVCAPSFLQHYSVRGQKFLAVIATGDDTLVPHHTPTTKCATMEWETYWVPRNKNFKILKAYDEVICTMFWEYKGVLFTHFKQKGATTNTTAFVSAMDRLQAAIKCNSNSTAQLAYSKNLCYMFWLFL